MKKFQFSISSKTSAKIKDYLIVVIVVGAFMPLMAHALPWETFTKTIACELSGAWVKWMAVIAIALGGVMFGLGELSGPFQKMMQIAGGFSISIGAVGVAAKLLGTDDVACDAVTTMNSIYESIAYFV